jgi:hypothetical protein
MFTSSDAVPASTTPLGRVERQVVGAEPEDAADQHAEQARPAHQRLAPGGDEHAERQAADEEPAEREGPRGELPSGVPDPDERRRPHAHGDERSDQRGPLRRRRVDIRRRGRRGRVRLRSDNRHLVH